MIHLKKPDYTILCFLEEDGEKSFTKEQVEEIKQIRKIVTSNGGIWLKTLDDVVSYLNSAKSRDKTLLYDAHLLNNVFISYGRRHSIALARKLYNSLKAKNYNIWFDMNDIPLGVDFQQQIDEGIRRAGNFIFVISPHSVNSIYCLKEIILALKYNKRIIPIIHVEPTDCWDKMHPLINKLNWIYLSQNEDFNIPLEQWEFIDSYDAGIEGLCSLIELQKDYVREHTMYLDSALEWEEHKKSKKYLLSGVDFENAFKWLGTKDFYKENGAEIQHHVFQLFYTQIL